MQIENSMHLNLNKITAEDAGNIIVSSDIAEKIKDDSYKKIDKKTFIYNFTDINTNKISINCSSNFKINYKININKSEFIYNTITDMLLGNYIRNEFYINDIKIKNKLLLNTSYENDIYFLNDEFNKKIYDNVNKSYLQYIYYNTDTPSILLKTLLSLWCDNISKFNKLLNKIIDDSNYKKLKNITAHIIETSLVIENISDKKKIELAGNVDIKHISGGNINLYTINEDNTIKTIGDMKLKLSLGEFNNINISSILSKLGLYKLNNNTNVSGMLFIAGGIQIDNTSTINNLIHHTGFIVNNGTINHLTIDDPIIEIFSQEKFLKELDKDIRAYLDSGKSSFAEIIENAYNKYIPNFKFSKIYNNNKINNIKVTKRNYDIITLFINLSGGVLSGDTLNKSNLNIINLGKISNKELYVKLISNIHTGEIVNSKIVNGMLTSCNNAIIKDSLIINTKLKLAGAKNKSDQIIKKLLAALDIPRTVISYIFDIVTGSIIAGTIITGTTLIMGAIIIICGLVLLAMTAAAMAMTVSAGINQLLEQFGVPKDEKTLSALAELMCLLLGLSITGIVSLLALSIMTLAAFIIVGVVMGSIVGFVATFISSTVLAGAGLADKVMAIFELFNPNFYFKLDTARPKLLNNKISGSMAEIHNSIIENNILTNESYTLLNNTEFINNTIKNSTGILSEYVKFENNILTGNNELTFIDYDGDININLSTNTESSITLNNISGSTIKNISYDSTISGNEYTVIINTKDDSTIENININPYKDKELTNIEVGTIPRYENALNSINSTIKDSNLLVSQLNSDNSIFKNTNIIISYKDYDDNIKLINTTIENKPLTFLNANTRTLDIEHTEIKLGIKLINSNITINAINENTLSNILCIYTTSTSTSRDIIIIGTPGKQTFEEFSITVKNKQSDKIYLDVNLQDVTCKTFTLDGDNNCNCKLRFDISNLTCETLNIKNYQLFNIDYILFSIKECDEINISDINSLTFNLLNTLFINTREWLFIENNSTISINNVNNINCRLQGIKGLDVVNINVLNGGSVYLDNVSDGAYTINGITSFSIINSPNAKVSLVNLEKIPSLHIQNHELAEGDFDGTDKHITLYGSIDHPLKGEYTNCNVGRRMLGLYFYKLLLQLYASGHFK